MGEPQGRWPRDLSQWEDSNEAGDDRLLLVDKYLISIDLLVNTNVEVHLL